MIKLKGYYSNVLRTNYLKYNTVYQKKVTNFQIHEFPKTQYWVHAKHKS